MGETYQRKVHKETLKIEICVDLLEKVSNDSNDFNEWNSPPTVGCTKMLFIKQFCVLCRAISRLLQWDYHMINQRGQDTLYLVCENWNTMNDFFSATALLILRLTLFSVTLGLCT